MEKTRVPIGERYWYVIFDKAESEIKVSHWNSLQDCFDELRYNSNNYFHTKEEAEAMARKLRAVLNGVDAIEMPSEEEVYNSCEQYIEQDNESRYGGCLNKDHYFEGWLACIDWLKSKIK